MLKCSCGWVGVNLRPDHEHNTALCPSCGAVFKGITADRAVCVSDEEEKALLDEYKVGMAMAETLFGKEE